WAQARAHNVSLTSSITGTLPQVSPSERSEFLGRSAPAVLDRLQSGPDDWKPRSRLIGRGFPGGSSRPPSKNKMDLINRHLVRRSRVYPAPGPLHQQTRNNGLT